MITYFLSDGKFIKIGKTRDLKQRIGGLQTANARKLRILTTLENDNEKTIHTYYKSFRVSGEWFKGVPEIFDLIEFIKTYNRRKCKQLYRQKYYNFIRIHQKDLLRKLKLNNKYQFKL